MRRLPPTALGVAAVTVALLTGCVAAPDRPTTGISASLFGAVLSDCEKGTEKLGVTTMAISEEGSRMSVEVAVEGGWYVRATTGSVVVAVGSPGGSFTPGEDSSLPDATDPEVRKATLAATTVQTCLSKYRFAHFERFPTSRADLLLLYKWDVGVLWPCLREHGFDPGAPPSRDSFVSLDKASQADPYLNPRLSKHQTVQMLASASRYCPEAPSYLGSADATAGN